MGKNRFLIFLFFFITTISIHAQNIVKGEVYDRVTKRPLEGVSIYYDGTTFGAITNDKGSFLLEIKNEIESPLVISYLGYETKIYEKSNLNQYLEVGLVEKSTSLDEVFLTNDDWSREKKLNIFRREFLGNTVSSLDCKIINEKDIRIVYNKNDDALYASSNKPILVENKYLGYQLIYNLVDFEVKFKTSLNGFRQTETVFYSGTSNFKELSRKVKNKYIKKRKILYNGSILHFMRSLSKGKLTENDFQVFIKDPSGKSKLYFQTLPEKVFSTKQIDGKGTEVTVFQKDPVTIRFSGLSQSSIVIEDEEKVFYIDDYGIYSPVERIYFGGDFGVNRISTMLPSNYGIEN